MFNLKNLKQMKKTDYFLMIFLMACFCLSAGARNEVKVERISAPGAQQITTATFPTKFSKDAQSDAFSHPTNLPAKASKAPENISTVTISCVPDCDDNYNKRQWQYNFVDQNGIIYVFQGYMLDFEPNYTIEIPCGTYDVAATYSNKTDLTQYYIIHEQVAINNDTTFSFSPDEATVHIQFEPRLPDGEKCYPETCIIYDDYSQETIADGNIGNLNYSTGIVTTDGSHICGLNGNWANIWTGIVERDATHNSDIYINQVSDRFVFCCNMSFPRYEFDNSFYVVDFELSTCKDTILTNNAEDYVVYEKQFKQTPYAIENGNGLHPGVSVSNFIYPEGLMGGARMMADGYTLNDNEPTKYYLCNSHEGINPTTCLVLPIVGEMPHPWMPDFEYLYTKDMYFTLQDGELIHANFGLFSVEENTYSFKPTPETASGVGYNHHFDDWNPLFSYPIGKMKTISGNSCPILVPTIQSQAGDANSMMKTLYFINHIGRNGEYRECDIWASRTTVKVNGESVAEGEGFFPFGWTKKADSQGVVDITVTNNNVDVDGLPGKNVTNIHFDMAGDDNTAPTLQMLDFRDTEDNAIDRFATAEEGTLQFCCGDFNEQYIDNEQHTQYFVCNDLANVEVAYSPYQADEWTPLEASEVAEYYYDGMGHYYSAPLANVTGQGLEGWFDLKIKMTDMSGNWQEQVISPAFRIDDLILSAVSDVKLPAQRTEVARYTLDGRRIGTPQPGINIIRYSDGTAHKVLVAQ